MDAVAAFTRSLSLGQKPKSQVELPDDFDYWIPVGDPQNWLLKWNLTSTELRENKIGYSPRRESLVFPVFGPEGLLMYQERYFGVNPKFPKWITKGAKDVLHFPKEHQTDRVVLVEDIVSAIKVSRVESCCPIFGSNLSSAWYLRLSKLFKHAVVWYDQDAKKHAMENALLLSSLMQTSLVFTDKDPKFYTTSDIREYLK